MIRRSPGQDPGARPWPAPGNQADETDVQEVGDTAAGPSADRTARGQAATEPDSGNSPPADSPERASRTHRSERDSRQRQTVREVNEYAFWCIENGMWNEAMIHLEQGLREDSLAASIHNNLGVVYERLGRRDQAAAAYGKARSLDQAKKAYRINLELFEDGGQPGRADSSQARSKGGGNEPDHGPSPDSAGPPLSPGE